MNTSAREDILGRIREALPFDALNPQVSHASIERAYQQTGTLRPEACVELFVDRLLDYDTEILQVADDDGLPAAIAEAVQRAGEKRVVAPAGFPAAWLSTDISVEFDNDRSNNGEKPLSTAEVDRAEVVLTTCEVAVASTGTIILVHGGGQGRRVLTLLPDHHICLVRRDQIVELVPEALAAIAAQSGRPITTISGPSATSDIEMTRIRGVHGPRRLTVILYGPHRPSIGAGA